MRRRRKLLHHLQKSQKLMADAIKTGAAPSKPNTKPPPTAPKPSCNVPSPVRQMSSSDSPLFPCHSLACCILSCHHVHFICMFFKTRIRSLSPLSVSKSDTLTRACRTSQILFRERDKNVLGMGRELTSGLGTSLVDRLSISFHLEVVCCPNS